MPGNTHQAILPAFALVVSRAGGGIVNDCLASGTPLVCVEERQWQVQLIERSCREMGLIPDYPECAMGAFASRPAECIDLFVRRSMQPRTKGIRTGAEHALAASILAGLSR